MKQINVKEVSPKLSMFGWDLLTYVKKRKKTLVTMIGGVIGYLITGDELIALISAGLFEMLLSLAEYYLKRVN